MMCQKINVYSAGSHISLYSAGIASK